MFPGNRSADRRARLEAFASGGKRPLRLPRLARVKQHKRVQIAVAGVENVSDSQPIPAADRGDFPQHFRQPAARNDAILH